jgi:hypothetical protein
MVQNQKSFAIGAIVKNEEPYLLEWIAFHRVIGIQRFVIADNDSTDGSKALLSALQALGIIEYFDFPTTPGEKPQMPAYSRIFEYANNLELEWIFFIDADEFIMPTTDTLDIFSCLEKATSQENVGAIAINWAIFGSSGIEQRNSGLVIEDFSWRSREDFGPNMHYKSLINLKETRIPILNPHHFDIKENYIYLNIIGQNLIRHPAVPVGLSAEVNWKPLRINHYITKSKQEFFSRKSAKGSAGLVGREKGAQYFSDYDRNDVFDPCSPALLEATILEKRRLSDLVDSFSKGTRAGFDMCRKKLLKIAAIPKKTAEYIPSDFEKMHYVLLNPDVLRAGVDPVEHYRDFGRKEERAYQIPRNPK